MAKRRGRPISVLTDLPATMVRTLNAKWCKDCGKESLPMATRCCPRCGADSVSLVPYRRGDKYAR